jgi:hypothetical protein
MPLDGFDLRLIVAEQRATKQAIAQAREELAEIKQLIRRLRPTRGLVRIKTFTQPGYGDTSERTVYRWEEEGRVKLIRIGGTVYVDLDHWFDQIERLRAEQARARGGITARTRAKAQRTRSQRAAARQNLSPQPEPPSKPRKSTSNKSVSSQKDTTAPL